MIELLILGFVTLAIICLWILIERKKDPKFLLWFIPTLLILVSSTYITYETILGYAMKGQPEKGVYLHHWVDEPDWIYLWMLEETQPRAYKMVYNREMHDKLEQVETKSKSGEYMIIQEEGMMGKRGEGADKKGKRVHTLGGGLEFYKWEHTDSMPSK